MTKTFKTIEITIGGKKIDGYAEATDIFIPGPHPDPPFGICQHLSLDMTDDELMTKGRCYTAQTEFHGRIEMILCEDCRSKIKWEKQSNFSVGCE